MTITFSDIRSAIKRHLSIIGKRLYSKDGQNMFSNITVSSNEDPIFNQYISAAAQNVEALLRQLVSTYSVVADTSISITLTNTRGTTDYDTRCGELIKSYITLLSTGEYLAMTHPDIAEKYRADAASAIQSLLSYAFYKEPPTTVGDPSAATASVS